MGRSAFENLRSIWNAEDRLIEWAVELLHREPYLIEHIELIECFMNAVDSARQALPKNDRNTALCGLFLRAFDAASHGLRAAMSGNYAGSAMYARDLLETSFLLNYLLDDEARPVEWLNADQRTLSKKYTPIEIRKKLDERDGFKKLRRHEHYSNLSKLGVHPTPQSFAMKRDGTRMLNGGPFKHEDLLKGCVEEIAKGILLLSAALVDYLGEFSDGPIFSSRLALLLQRAKEKYSQS